MKLPLLASCFMASILASQPQYHNLPPLKEQALIQDAWTQERRENIPALLQKHKVDAWLISQKEYAEDTTFWSLKTATQLSARRRTTSIFFSSEINCTAETWIDITPQIWKNLTTKLEKCNPKSIVINTDPQIAFASGLHSGERDLLLGQLGREWEDKFVNEPIVAVEFIATMPKAQMGWYKKMMETAWAMISEAFSEAVITPGETKTEDVEWWLREKIQAMNYTTWFHPSVSILEPGTDDIGPPHDPDQKVITYGDLLHVDFGVTALGLNTDTQHLAYVLHPGQTENDIPQGFIEGLKTGNKLQDIVRSNMKLNLTGNQILHNAREEMHATNISGQIYSHPIGDWGHSAGTLIGMTNLQEGIPVLGDLPLLKDMYYSVELYAEHFVPERNGTFNFFLEEDVYWDEETEGWEWVFGRQERFHLIKSEGKEGLFKVQL